MSRIHGLVVGAALLGVVSSQSPPQRKTPAQVGINHDIVVVRMPRQAPQRQEHFQDAFNMSLFIGRGAELVLIHPNGSEETLFSAGPIASATDPCVSFDGRTVYFSLFVDPENTNPQRFLSQSPAHIWKIDIATKQATQLTFGTAPSYPDSGRGINPGYALFDIAPVELPDGRILFLSTRDGHFSVTGRWPAPAFWRMNPDGSNKERMEWFSQAGCQHPLVLEDGRVIWTHRHNAGRRQIGGHSYGLMIGNQDLSDIKSFAGLHYRASAWHFATQLSNGDIVSTAYYHGNNFGHGTLVRFPVDPGHPSGQVFGPASSDPNVGQTNSYGVNDHYPRVSEQLVGPWQIPAAGVLTYDAQSPLLPNGQRAGKTTMPAALPGGHMLFVWSPGGVFFGAAEFPDMKVCYAKDGWLTSHSDIVVLKEDPGYHYSQPKPVVPYLQIHGVTRPALLPDVPNDGSTHPVLPPGAPFSTTGTSSVYNRESSWPASYTDAWSQPLINNYAQITAFRNVGQDTYRFPDSEIWAAQIVVDMARVDTRYANLNGNLKSHNNGQQIWGVLGEIPLRKFDTQGQPILDPNGDPDTSYEVRIPANVPFHHRVIDRNGLTLTAEQTWHSTRPGERKNNCGGCHAHSTDTNELAFSQTVAGQPGYNITDFALQTPLVDRDAQGAPTVTNHPVKVRSVEYYKDVKPIFDAKCASCHMGAAPAGGLDLADANAWDTLAYKPDPLVPFPSGHQPTRYVRYNSATQSYLIWKLFGKRLDGRTNGARSTDQDYSGTIMPPPGSPYLSFEEIRTIAMWVDLGCLVDLTPGVASVADPSDDQMKPTLVIGGIDTHYNEAPLPPLTVSAYDVHRQLDPNSLSVVIQRSNGSVSANLAAGLQLQDGAVYNFSLAGLSVFPDETHTIFVDVADMAGNFARRRLSVTPRSLRYQQTPWTGGTVVSLTAEGGKPGDLVFFLGSLNGQGLGPTLIPSLQLDLLAPFFVIAGLAADPNGSASLSFPLPVMPVLAQLGVGIYTQAIAVRGPGGRDSVRSRPLADQIR